MNSKDKKEFVYFAIFIFLFLFLPLGVGVLFFIFLPDLSMQGNILFVKYGFLTLENILFDLIIMWCFGLVIIAAINVMYKIINVFR